MKSQAENDSGPPGARAQKLKTPAHISGNWQATEIGESEEFGQRFRTLILFNSTEKRSRVLKWREVRGSDGSLSFENAERKYKAETPFSIDPSTDKKIREAMAKIVEGHELSPLPEKALPEAHVKSAQPKPASSEEPKQLPSGKGIKGMRFMEIPVDLIRPNPTQPRKNIWPEDLEEMKMSLKSEGQNTPIDVIEVEKDPKSQYPNAVFELVKGERRWTAAPAIGLKTLYAIVHSKERIPDKVAQHRFCLVGDHHHKGYDPIEIAFSIKYQNEEGGLTLEEIGQQLCGKRSVAWVSNAMAIANLHPELMKRLDRRLPRSEQISTSIAWRLARWPKERQIGAYAEVKKEKGSRLQLIKIKQLATEQIPNKHPGRPRKPADNVKVLTVAIPRMTADALTVNSYPDDTIKSLVQNRPDDARLALEQISKTIDNLRSIEARIKKAQKMPGLAKAG